MNPYSRACVARLDEEKTLYAQPDLLSVGNTANINLHQYINLSTFCAVY